MLDEQENKEKKHKKEYRELCDLTRREEGPVGNPGRQGLRLSST